MSSVIKVENVSKQYRLGQVGTGALVHDVNRWWHRFRGKEDPYLKIGDSNDRTVKGNSEYVWALKDINFEVQQGEVLGIIGRNGAGKSTLLKILSRTTTPTTGNIKIKGRVASLLEVGTGFHPELSGRDNIFLNGAILGMTRHEIKSKFDEIVDFAGVERYIDTPVKRYSSGMYVRLAFAVAAHLEPEILIVDEVLAVGDADFQKKALGKMKDVSGKEGRTVLFVSHNMDAVSTLTNNGILVENGSILFKGLSQETISYYLSKKINNQVSYRGECKNTPAFIKEINIRTSDLNGVHNFSKPISFEFIIECFEKVRNATLSFQLFDEYEKAILHAWVFDTDQNFCREEGLYSLECKIDDPRLYMGRYSLTAHFGESKGGKKFETLQGACSFEVNMFGNYREYDWTPNTCTYIEKFYWNVKKNTTKAF